VSKSDEKDEQDAVIRCWCGESGTYDELFADDLDGPPCGGLGVLHCFCGGDFCVCHHHGEAECPGCEECRHDEEWQDQEDYE